MSGAATREAFEARLRRIGAERYHDKHPFHERLHGGRCTLDEVRAWVVNRLYYQSRIPMKDAAFMSRIDDPALRRAWRSRIEDHDGTAEKEGGIARRSRRSALLTSGDDPARRRQPRGRCVPRTRLDDPP